jgi:very-short-patch-repair endonuclease
MKQNKTYNKHLKPVANKLRISMTKSEACIWKYGLISKKQGVIFRRQSSVLLDLKNTEIYRIIFQRT